MRKKITIKGLTKTITHTVISSELANVYNSRFLLEVPTATLIQGLKPLGIYDSFVKTIEKEARNAITLLIITDSVETFIEKGKDDNAHEIIFNTANNLFTKNSVIATDLLQNLSYIIEAPKDFKMKMFSESSVNILDYFVELG